MNDSLEPGLNEEGRAFPFLPTDSQVRAVFDTVVAVGLDLTCACGCINEIQSLDAANKTPEQLVALVFPLAVDTVFVTDRGFVAANIVDGVTTRRGLAVELGCEPQVLELRDLQRAARRKAMLAAELPCVRERTCDAGMGFREYLVIVPVGNQPAEGAMEPTKSALVLLRVAKRLSSKVRPISTLGNSRKLSSG